MKNKLLLLLFCLCFSFLKAQHTLSYLKVKENSATLKSIVNADFKEFKNSINNSIQQGDYWIKVENIEHKKTIIQVTNYHIKSAVAFQNNKRINPEKQERFNIFKVTNNSTVYLKISITKEAYIPIKIWEETTYQINEKYNLLYLGFYYGFAFIIVLINIFYFINFKENTFIYYALFLFCISLGFVISDDFLHFFGLSQSIINIIEVFDHFLVSVFCTLFTISYLQLDNYYPKSRIYGFSICVIVLFLAILYISTNNFNYFFLMEIFVFVNLIFYFISGVSIFRKNLFIKILVFAEFFILTLGISFYVTKLLGIPLVISSYKLKFGGFFEMIILSFAVIYRMKILQQENERMTKEIIEYSNEIKNLSEEISKEKETKTEKLEEALSIREHEIFSLLTSGKTNKEISFELNISVNTVKFHIKNIYEKLNIKSRKEALVIAKN